MPDSAPPPAQVFASDQPPPGLFWLTRDFRFCDNPALLAALSEGPVLAVFLIDEMFKAQGAAIRWRLGRALQIFDRDLRRRSGSGVLVLEGEAEEIFPALLQATGAKVIHQNDWPAPQMRGVHHRLNGRLAGTGARLFLHRSHLLADPARIRTKQGGSFRVFTPFARALRLAGVDRPVVPAPDRFPGAVPPLQGPDPAALDLAPDLFRGAEVLAEFAAPAGEEAAFERLEAFFKRIRFYPEGRDFPDLDLTSGLSEHFATGEISARTVWTIAEMRAGADSGIAPGVDKFLSELAWREFAWHLLLDFPDLPEQPWRGEWVDFPWRGASEDLSAWQQGRTGVALVDAGLREMRVTGRMHNRVRMVVASWLTKHLLTDWRLGMAHFAESLTDWDPAVNAMNWQWVAGCGPDASPFFRIFNPEKQAEKFDAKSRYRGLWLSGWQGGESAQASAYYASLPGSWQMEAPWQPAHPFALEAGRQRALDSYQAFRLETEGKSPPPR